jgi:hypothetical protein
LGKIKALWNKISGF